MLARLRMMRCIERILGGDVADVMRRYLSSTFSPSVQQSRSKQSIHNSSKINDLRGMKESESTLPWVP
jgi:hypothetical protein